jgi:ATP/maltotriose-dependent transcriptional regulator MalT
VWSAIECFETVQSHFADAAHQILAQIQISAGDLQGAEMSLQRVDATLAAQGEHAYRSTVQAILADVSETLGSPEAARAAIQLSDTLSADEDVINYAITHRVRARLALADGDGEAAERWAHSAVRFACLTDFVLYQAQAKLELAQVLVTLGHRARGAAEARAALALQEMKGDRPGSEKTRVFLEGLPI